MFKKIIHFFFFGNYFIGLLALALNLETAHQLKLPLNSFIYYILIGLLPILYYTYAYSNAHKILKSENPRVLWYKIHHDKIKISQLLLLTICIVLGLIYFMIYFKNLKNISVLNWSQLVVMVAILVFYYGTFPKSVAKASLRNSGWLKATFIGFSWACCASFLPLLSLKLETGIDVIDGDSFWIWLFIKNLIFCTVNAILFDIKDYPSDANRHMKTFIVRFGIRKTIFYIIQPLIISGFIAFLIFAGLKNIAFLTIVFNSLPFVAVLLISYGMFKRRSILYYLIVIDGVILFKAFCGIVGSFFN